MFYRQPPVEYRCRIGRKPRQKRHRVWRHYYLPSCLISPDVPLRMNCAVWGLVVEADTLQPSVKIRVKVDSVEPGISWDCVNPCAIPVQPLSNSAICIVVIGIHARVVEHLIAIPTLPCGCAAVLDD